MAARKSMASKAKPQKPANRESPATESAFAVLVAILVIFTAMLDPSISVGLAVGMIVFFACYKFLVSRGMWPGKC